MPLYTYPDYLTAIREHGAGTSRGTRVVYSDLNFILLFAVDAARRLRDRRARANLRAPRHRATRCSTRRSTLRPRIAATEWGQRFEASSRRDSRSIAVDSSATALMWGETNDGNSFTTPAAPPATPASSPPRATSSASRRRGRGELLPRELVRGGDARASDDRGLESRSPAGRDSRAIVYGHTGFTGTSVWVDDGDGILVLLTNRVHPCAAPIAMQRIRGEFHRARARA